MEGTVVAGRAPISGHQLLLALLAIGLATAVVPPLAASRLNTSRIARTQTIVGNAVRFAQSDAGRQSIAATGANVICGSGLVPKAASAEIDEWRRATLFTPNIFGNDVGADAWGQCLVFQQTSGRAWIVSAGPNGLLETPLGAAALVGDDIGAIVR